MNHCTACGHPLGTGRFCTECGAPVDGTTDRPGATAPEPDATATMPAVAAPPSPAPQSPAPQSPSEEWQTDTAERPVTTPVPDTPPPTWTPPPPSARFPLFADEVEDEPGAGPVQVLPVDGAPPAEVTGRRHRPWGWWAAVAGIVLVVVGLAVVLLVGDDSPPTRRAPSAGGGSHAGGAGGPAGSLTDRASVVVPATAAPGQDVGGNRVTYVGGNMLDGVPETAWRMPGDGTGAEITLTLPRGTHLSSVGLINGYAKQAQRSGGGTLDWYHGNRRIEKVEWVFGDGTRVAQDLQDTTAVQSTDVDVETSTITLRLISVSEPGPGPASRDFTAISDLSLINHG